MKEGCGKLVTMICHNAGIIEYYCGELDRMGDVLLCKDCYVRKEKKP